MTLTEKVHSVMVFWTAKNIPYVYFAWREDNWYHCHQQRVEDY